MSEVGRGQGGHDGAILVLYFAGLKELVGCSEERLDVSPENDRVGALIEQLCVRHPILRGRLGSVRYAVNEEMCEIERRVGAGDVVALIPPVSGG